MKEWEIYDKVLKENGYCFEDEYFPGGFSNSTINFLKYTYSELTHTFQRYEETKVYFDRNTDEVSSFFIYGPEIVIEKVKHSIKAELRNNNIDSILEE